MNDPTAIDNMVAALSNAGADLSSPVKQGHANVIYNSEADTFTEMAPAPPTNGLVAQQLLDDGRDLHAAHAAILDNVNSLQAKLDSVTCSAAGEQQFTVTGREREVLQLRVEQARRSGAYDISQLNALLAQRNQQGSQIATSEGLRSLEAEAARAAFLDSAPRGMRAQYAADYDRETQAARTRSVTDAVAAAQRKR